MFAKHLPPSAAAPRVWVLGAGADLPPEIQCVSAEAARQGSLDAIVGEVEPRRVRELSALLRPGGRLIFAAPDEPATLLAALTEAGLIHCLVEEHGALTLYRGERPPLGDSLARVQATANAAHTATSFLFLLIQQTPNKPAWKLAPDDVLEWRAATVIDPAIQQPTLLAFSSLLKAVAFMQPAVLARFLNGVNKVGKFPAHVAHDWSLPYLLNPDFEQWRTATLGPLYAVDPNNAITGDE